MIHNITTATVDDIILLLLFLSDQNRSTVVLSSNVVVLSSKVTPSDDVIIYPVELCHLPGAIITLSNVLNWLEKCNYFRPIFVFNLLSAILGAHSWPLSVYPLRQYATPKCLDIV